MQTRAKVVLLFKQEGPGYDWLDSKGEITKHERASIELRFGAVYSPDPNTENYSFWKATPNMSMTMYVDNHAAVDGMEIGQEFYLDFTPVPKP
jgi:hypothetical protein